MIRPTKRTFEIALYLRTGFAPWGVQLARSDSAPMIVRVGPTKAWQCGETKVPRRPAHWVMCCGNTLSDAEILRWFEAELVVEGRLTDYGCRTAVQGPALEWWLSNAWSGLEPARWKKQA